MNINHHKWKYLEPREGWRKQLYIKGTKIPAAAIWITKVVNGLSVEESANNWELTVDQVKECINYCESNLELLQSEALEEAEKLANSGIRLTKE